MFRKILSAIFAIVTLGSTVCSGEVFAADRQVVRKVIRHGLPAGLPRAHYAYRTTIISGPPVPYDARPYAYGRYGYAPYINSYGIPAAVVVDPVDPAWYWRRPVYGYATPYSCLFYSDC